MIALRNLSLLQASPRGAGGQHLRVVDRLPEFDEDYSEEPCVSDQSPSPDADHFGHGNSSGGPGVTELPIGTPQMYKWVDEDANEVCSFAFSPLSQCYLLTYLWL